MIEIDLPDKRKRWQLAIVTRKVNESKDKGGNAVATKKDDIL